MLRVMGPLALVAASCGAPLAPLADAGGDATAPTLEAMVDAIMAPAFTADPFADPTRCRVGVAAVVTRDHALVRGYGVVDAAGTRAPDGASLFQLGSISKVLTGLIVAREVEEGRWRTETRAVDVAAPDLAVALSAADFTLGDLASHHAGLPPMPANLVDRDGDGVRDPDADPLSPGAGYARVDLLTALDGVTGGAAPYAYSNLGLGLLGVLAADQLGLPGFDALLAARLRPALGLTSTWGQVAAIPVEDRARVAQGYALQGPTRVSGRLAEMGVLAAAGEAVTSGDDLLALLGALTGQRSTELDAAIVRALTPLGPGPDADTSIGYAFELRRDGARLRYTKGGATPSYTAYLSFHRDPPVGAAVLTACGGFERARALAMALDDALVATAP